jgi:hypothetical protein
MSDRIGRSASRYGYRRERKAFDRSRPGWCWNARDAACCPGGTGVTDLVDDQRSSTTFWFSAEMGPHVVARLRQLLPKEPESTQVERDYS